MLLPALESEIIIHANDARGSRHKFEVCRPSVAGLHRLGRHGPVRDYHLFQKALAIKVLEMFKAIGLPDGFQLLRQYIRAFDPLDIVAGIQEKLDFGPDDFSEHFRHRIHAVRWRFFCRIVI